MTVVTWIVIGILLGEFLLELWTDVLNLKRADPALPREFEGFYDAEKYGKAQRYLRERTVFSLARKGFFALFISIFIVAGGFCLLDNAARSFGGGPIVSGLIFAGMILVGSQVLSVPFSVYGTFVIEEKFGFNRTKPMTFATDLLKGLILTALFGGVLFAAILWFFESFGALAWLYSWIAAVLFELFLTFIAPVAIMPLFNKFIPLEDGELKNAVTSYAKAQDFKLQGLFKMDASKRSSKSNAFFTGFGRFRRIALFDTLIAKHTTEELVSVLAHEIGHYKKGHILKHLAMSVLTTGVMFFALSFFIKNPLIFDAFRMDAITVYASLVFFGFLFSPINLLVSIASNAVSRKHEYEADRFAVETYHKPEEFIRALKKLSVDNLSNLTPHPLKVFLEYTHPPVLERIRAIRERKGR